MDNRDLEKGPQYDQEDQIQTSSDARPQPDQPKRLPRNPHFKSELKIFQCLVGIDYLEDGGEQKKVNKEVHQVEIPNFLLAIFWPSQTIKQRMHNRGLYNRAMTQDLKNRTMYTITRYIISGLFILQVLVAATLTALASYQTSSTVVLTILGAINTVVAGLLAWLTGQGMPTRFRRARDQYREVVRACEEMERKFAQIDHYDWPEGQRPDPVTERDRLNKMFDDARKDQEANYPETTRSPQAEKDRETASGLHDEVKKWRSKKKEQESTITDLEKEIINLKSAGKKEME